MDISVLKSMKVIRDAAMALQGAEVAPLVAAAVEVANAYEESLSQHAIVSVGSAALSADEIAAKVVERLDILAVQRVKVALPDGVPPVPWRTADFGLVLDAADTCVLSEDDIGINLSPIDRHNTVRAIVEAVNAYYGCPQQPSPAEAATANSETQLPDTAGYPVLDYDAVEIPESEVESLKEAVRCDGVKNVSAAIDASISVATCREQRLAIAMRAVKCGLAICWLDQGLQDQPMQPAFTEVMKRVSEVVQAAVKVDEAGQSPSAA